MTRTQAILLLIFTTGAGIYAIQHDKPMAETVLFIIAAYALATLLWRLIRGNKPA